MTSARIDEVYRVIHTEDVIIGPDAYRLEVLHCVRNVALDPATLDLEAYTVRAYKRLEIALQPQGSATVWAHIQLHETHEYRLEDQALADAHEALLLQVGGAAGPARG